MDLRRCSRCGESKTLGEFPPSKTTNSGQWCRACLRRAKCGPDVDRACDGCGAVLRVTERRAAETRVYCSRPCKSRHRNHLAKLNLRAAKAALPPRHCPHCGDVVPVTRRADALFCSASCEQAAHNATRKASWKIGAPAEYVSRAEIIARDEGRCHICGDTPAGSELHLDHVVPLARGGTHHPDNLAVACARCNLRKGARLEGRAHAVFL